jgi:hypothetical protein
MAELDPSIIFRQEKYSGPTQDELDAKQDMNALRNMLGAGQAIDSPEVVNSMLARNPDLGLKLMTNASTMQTNAASAQKNIADARAKDREARLAEVDRYFPVGMAIAQAGDQEGWDQFGTFLGQKFGPEALMGYPRDVKQAGEYLQRYLEAKKQYEAKNGGSTPRFGAPVVTTTGYYGIEPTTGMPTSRLVDPDTKMPLMPPPKGSGDGGSSVETFSTTAPQTITLADGTVVPYVLGSFGTSKPVPLPPGAKWNVPTTTVSTPTSTDVIQKGTGVVVTSRAKDVIGAALQEEVGAARGKELAAAPAAVANGTRFLAQLDALAADPNIERGTGLSSYFNFVRGADGKSFQVKLDKAVGSAFLESIKGLQGTGAVTDREGGAATASLSGLDAGLDAPSFKKELEILRGIVRKGLAKARENAAERDRILGITPTEEEPAAPAGAGAGAPSLFSPEELAKLRGGQ